MEKMKILLAAATILIAGAIFHSCQKENVQPVKEQGTMVLKDVPTPGGMPLCDEGCLEDGPFYLITTSWTLQWSPLAQFSGFYRNNKYLVASSWHDGEYFYIQSNVFGYQYDQVRVGQGQNGEWTLVGPTYDNYPFSTIIITLNGTEYTYEMDDPNTPDVTETAIEYIQAFPLPEGWEACTPMVYTVRIEGEGGPVWLGTQATPAFYTYELYDYCSCEESFNYVDNEDGSYTFTYIPAEDMANAELVFTFPQSALDGDPLYGWTYNGQTMQTTMDLEACEIYTFIVNLSCKDLNNPQNKWTDFKVGDDSKKGDLANINCD
jgi:hypothetical protein